jgi:hypothetical protein
MKTRLCIVLVVCIIGMLVGTVMNYPLIGYILGFFIGLWAAILYESPKKSKLFNI